MPRLSATVPKYRKHRASGQAVVTLSGRDHYLGPHGTQASKREYDRLIGEWLQTGRRTSEPDHQLTVVEVIAAYRKFAANYYVKDGKQTSEYRCVLEALAGLKRLYGRTPASEFRALALQVVQQDMVERGLSRGVVNRHVGRVKRMFRWAASRELVDTAVTQSLGTVDGLRSGKTEARETDPVQPVDDARVEQTLPHLPAVVADMVRFQRLTGARPGGVCLLRPVDIDRSANVWEYRPESHKTEHHGRRRVIFIGPKAQGILRPYLLRPDEVYCFSPKDAVRKLRALRSDSRKTPLKYGNRPGSNRKAHPNRMAGVRYTADSYRKAIQRACVKARFPKWSPNQLRHTTATEVRKRFGLEAAQVTLGHAKADVTQIYAERDMQKAAAIMAEVG